MLKRYRKLQRCPDGPFSLLLTKPIELILLPVIVRIPVSPNLWTVISFLFKLWSAWLILSGQITYMLPVWLALALITDGFDGGVARWRGTSSFTGAYLDRGLDRIANSLIVAALGTLIWLESSGPIGLMLPLVLILLEISHEVLRVWIHLTGGLLENRQPLPGWDRWLRQQGILPFYAQDSLYFFLAVGLLTTNSASTGMILLPVIGISFIYLAVIHGRAARSQGEKGKQLWYGFLKTWLIRIVGSLVFTGVGFLIVCLYSLPFSLLFSICWTDFFAFYLLANRLMSESARMPDDPDEQEEFLRDLQRRDYQFLLGWYP